MFHAFIIKLFFANIKPLLFIAMEKKHQLGTSRYT